MYQLTQRSDLIINIGIQMAANPRMIDTNTHIRRRTRFCFMAFRGDFKGTIRLFKISICIKIFSCVINRKYVWYYSIMIVLCQGYIFWYVWGIMGPAVFPRPIFCIKTDLFLIPQTQHLTLKTKNSSPLLTP